VRAGHTIASLGGDLELALDTYTAVDKVVVDDWEAVRTKPDVRQLVEQGAFDPSRVHADFVQLVTGQRPGRERPDERILVRSEGLAIMDTAIAYHLYRAALARGIGRSVA
jgi:ornithine cyclodeaminase/alanine dehydrogenase-like protein (mu-crystallin family)